MTDSVDSTASTTGSGDATKKAALGPQAYVVLDPTPFDPTRREFLCNKYHPFSADRVSMMTRHEMEHCIEVKDGEPVLLYQLGFGYKLENRGGTLIASPLVRTVAKDLRERLLKEEAKDRASGLRPVVRTVTSVAKVRPVPPEMQTGRRRTPQRHHA